MKIFNIILEIIGWLQIAAGIALGIGMIAFVIYTKWDSHQGKIVAIVVFAFGVLSGVVVASKISIKHGTINWLSRISKSS